MLQGESRKHNIAQSHDYPDHPMIIPFILSDPLRCFLPLSPLKNWTPEVRLMSVQGVCKSFNGCWTDDWDVGNAIFDPPSSKDLLMPPKTIMIQSCWNIWNGKSCHLCVQILCVYHNEVLISPDINPVAICTTEWYRLICHKVTILWHMSLKNEVRVAIL